MGTGSKGSSHGVLALYTWYIARRPTSTPAGNEGPDRSLIKGLQPNQGPSSHTQFAIHPVHTKPQSRKSRPLAPQMCRRRMWSNTHDFPPL